MLHQLDTLVPHEAWREGVLPEPSLRTMQLGLIAFTPENLTTAERHTRVKRWDLESGGPAVIDVPAAGTPLILEDGVQITFTTVPEKRNHLYC